MAILSALTPLFSVSKIFGAAPFRFSASNTVLDLAYTKIFIACNFLLRICIFIADRDDLILISNISTTISAVVDTFCFEFLCFFSYIWVLYNCKEILVLLRRFDRLSLLRLLSKKDLKKIYIHSFIFVTFYNFLNLANFINTLFNSFPWDFISFISTFHDFFYSLLPLHLNLQFIFLVGVLSMCYDKLVCKVKLYLKHINHAERQIYYKRFLKEEKIDILSSCQKFSEVSGYIQELAQDLNNCFSFISLISIAYSFVDSLYAVYFSYFVGLVPLLSFSLWISYVQIKVLATVIVCSSMKRKVSVAERIYYYRSTYKDVSIF